VNADTMKNLDLPSGGASGLRERGQIENTIEAPKRAGTMPPDVIESCGGIKKAKMWDGHNQLSAMTDPQAMLAATKVPYGWTLRSSCYKTLAQTTINRQQSESDRLDKEAQKAKAETGDSTIKGQYRGHVRRTRYARRTRVESTGTIRRRISRSGCLEP
jgi:hypothetical protein